MKSFILSLIAIVIISGNAWASFDIEPYFPLSSGDSWSYIVDDFSPSVATVTEGTTIINGVSTKEVQFTDGFIGYYTNDASGIQLHRQFEPGVFILGVGTVDLTVTFIPPIKIADAETDIGQIVNSSGIARTNNLPELGVLDLPYSSSFTVEGFESITVPGGDFTVVQLLGTLTADGELVSSILYLARKIGIIKTTETINGITETLELRDTNVIPIRSVVDFDGDGVTDVAVYEEGTGNWFVMDSSSSFFSPALNFGGAGFVPVPGDYDGDGVTDAAVYEESTGNWFFVGSTSGFGSQLGFGGAGFIPVPGDYDGDGVMDAAVYEESTGNWFFVGSTSGFNSQLGFGGTGFIPVPEDYDGDGVMDAAVYEEATGNWFVIGSTSGFFNLALAFGGEGFIPVPGDYDGDGVMDAAVYEGATGNWFVVGSTSGLFNLALAFGGAGFIPVPGDYDGDGVTDATVYEEATGNWFVIGSTSGFFTPALNFGGPGFVPVLQQVTILREMGLF